MSLINYSLLAILRPGMNKVRFSFTELIAIVIILAILFSGLASFLSNVDQFSRQQQPRQQREILLSHLRYLQIRAISDEINRWGIRLGNGFYQGFYVDPNGQYVLVVFPAISENSVPCSLSFNNEEVFFDNLGRSESNFLITLPQGQSVQIVSGSGHFN